MLDPITTVTVSDCMAETMFTASFLNFGVVHYAVCIVYFQVIVALYG